MSRASRPMTSSCRRARAIALRLSEAGSEQHEGASPRCTRRTTRHDAGEARPRAFLSQQAAELEASSTRPPTATTNALRHDTHRPRRRWLRTGTAAARQPTPDTRSVWRENGHSSSTRRTDPTSEPPSPDPASEYSPPSSNATSSSSAATARVSSRIPPTQRGAE